MSMFEVRVIELNGLQDYGFIQFLRVEILDVRGYGPTFFGHVRYALNDVEQEESLPMDLSKGIFIATLRDDQLGDIPRKKLEATLQEASAKIIEIVRKDPNMQTLVPDYDYPMYDEDYSNEKLSSASDSILKSILEKDYSYLKYDEDRSKPPDLLRCRVRDPESSRQVEHIFKIAQKLRDKTGENYVVAYWGSSNPGDNLDEVWSGFSLRKFDFKKVSSK